VASRNFWLYTIESLAKVCFKNLIDSAFRPLRIDVQCLRQVGLPYIPGVYAEGADSGVDEGEASMLNE
jgi:hypothetical protein